MRVDKGSEAYKQLAYALLKAKVETQEVLKARHERRVIKTPPKPVTPVTVTSMESDKNDPTITQVEDNPFQTLQLQIIGAVALFEREIIKERQREKIAKAQPKGKHCRRKAKLSKKQMDEIRRRS